MLDAANRNTKRLKKTANCRLPSPAVKLSSSIIVLLKTLASIQVLNSYGIVFNQ